jgi:hypothetical protein
MLLVDKFRTSATLVKICRKGDEEHQGNPLTCLVIGNPDDRVPIPRQNLILAGTCISYVLYK